MQNCILLHKKVYFDINLILILVILNDFCLSIYFNNIKKCSQLFVITENEYFSVKFQS